MTGLPSHFPTQARYRNYFRFPFLIANNPVGQRSVITFFSEGVLRFPQYAGRPASSDWLFTPRSFPRIPFPPYAHFLLSVGLDHS